MSTSLQVLYPIVEGSDFDCDYYLNKHMPIVGAAIGQYVQSTLLTRGVAGGAGTPAGYYAIATIVFANQSAMDSAMANIGPAVQDIPNFTSTQPQMLIGEVVGSS
jgi:uncharacterized protein (TIGR02118 family)